MTALSVSWNMHISSTEDIAYKLENIAKQASEGARFAMRDGAIDIANLATRMAPVELANLEEAIKYRLVRDSPRHRASFEVYIDGTLPAEHPDRPSTIGKTVGEYAMIMHEGSYNLGKWSLIKQASEDVLVGPKFITRAAEELHEEIREDVEAKVFVRIGK